MLMPESIRQFARDVIHTEAAAAARMADAIDDAFERAARLILDCRGAVLTCGVGKAGHIARKLAASFSSTGTPSHFLNPSEALHGDVGAVRAGDVVLILSYSGETDEVLRMLSVVKKLDHPVISMTAAETNSLGRASDIVLKLGRIDEACPLGLAPTATTTAMLALGDALVLSVMRLRDFTAADFAQFHPAGQLGRKLIRVREAMTFRRGENLPLAPDTHTVRQVLLEVSTIKRRCGAVVLVNDAGRIAGLFTDADLRRLITRGDDDAAVLDRPVRDVMAHNPTRINGDALASEAMAIMKQKRYDELPVVDTEDRPIGLIDVQDLVILKMFDLDAESA